MKKWRRYLLFFFLLICGGFLYFFAQPVFTTPKAGETKPAFTNAGSKEVKPKEQALAKSVEHYRFVWEHDIFGKSQAAFSPDKTPLTAIPLTNADLGLRLVGTAVMENSGKSLAMIEHEDTGLQESYWEGSRLGGVLVKKILQDKVVVDAGGEEMILSMDPIVRMGKRDADLAGDSLKSASLSTSAYPARLNREEVAREYPDYPSFIKTAGMESRLQAGSPGGILIRKIDSHGLFGKMGLQEGDVIKEVNGEPLAGFADAVKIYDRLKHGGRINLGVQRGDENMRLRFYVG